MTVYSQKQLKQEKPSGLKRDLKMFWQFLWDVPSGRPKKTEKKVLWHGKVWI